MDLILIIGLSAVIAYVIWTDMYQDNEWNKYKK